jgi:geranylgeranyl diphosphate synthase type II
MRPLLVLLGNHLFGGRAADALPAALAAELFHNFTLVHDDIMDNAALRRGKPTVHQKWGQSTAILSGDVMLVSAYRELARSKAEHLPALLSIFNRTAAEVCEGQQMDMDFEREETVTIDQYLQMTGLKTAVLLGACLEMGAVTAGAGQDELEKLYAFGKGIGIAFQLQDDALDVFGDEHTFGKKKGGDIAANKKTFLSIKALELASPAQRNALRKWEQETGADSGRKIAGVCAIYRELEIERHALEAFRHYYQDALSRLDLVKAEPGRKAPIYALVEELFDRQK